MKNKKLAKEESKEGNLALTTTLIIWALRYT